MVKASSSTCITSRQAWVLLTGLEFSRLDLLAQIFGDLQVHEVRHLLSSPCFHMELVSVGGVGGHREPDRLVLVAVAGVMSSTR
jgi:hypothetical protein